MGNACRPFGIDEDVGMRVFSIVEMFIAFYHIVSASSVYRNIVEVLYDQSKREGLNDCLKTVMALGAFLTITQCLQAVLGFLLYLKGWKERNAFICYMWIGVAIINETLSVLIPILEIANGKIELWSRYQLYLLYVFYGIWVIRSFLKWAREQGYRNAHCCNRGREDSIVVSVELATGPPRSSANAVNPSKQQKSGSSVNPPGNKRASMASQATRKSAAPTSGTSKTKGQAPAGSSSATKK